MSKRLLGWLISGLVGSMAVAGLLAWADKHRSMAVEAVESHLSPAPALVHTTSVTLPTYPYTHCLHSPQTGVAGVPFQTLDWDCMASAGPPVSQSYTLLALSNDYLTVTLLPELGGRVYEMIFKPTGNNGFYRNPVIKPAPFGPPFGGEQHTWWLAVGGIEWGFPTDEHGYEWGVPWDYHIVSGTTGITVTVRDSDALDRATVAVDVHLPADRAALVVRPRLANPTGTDVGVKYWTNAMLAPGGDNAVSPDLRFLFPTDHVTVHSTGDPDLPPVGQTMDWPVHAGRDYSRLGNWDQWLGFFQAPQALGPYAGVYDTAADEGVLRVYPADVAQGSKGFAFGWSDPLPPEMWTDDDSTYVEVHGGLMPTFWDTATLAPGQVISWTEVWFPVAGLGGVSAASPDAALRLEAVGDDVAVGLYTPAVRENVDLYLWRGDCTPVGHWRLARVDPAHPAVFTVAANGLTPDDLSLVAISSEGVFLGGVNPVDCLPPVATVEPLPFFVTTDTFTVTWRGDDTWSGIASFDVQARAGYVGVWTDWLTDTPASAAPFAGTDGQTYFFRARARDGVGNLGVHAESEWGQAFTSVLLSPAPVLVTSRKLAEPLSPVPGQPVSYTVRISNTGNLTAAFLALTDRTPPTLVLISGTLSASRGALPVASGDAITWRGVLSPGQEIEIGYALTATSQTEWGVSLTNTAQVVADGLAPLTRRAVIVYWHRFYLPIISQSALRP